MNCCEEFLNACRLGNLFAVQSYLDEGLSVDVQNSEGETALQIAAANGFIDIVSLLLDKGAAVDQPNCYGWTPLMHAARHGHSSTVAYLLKMKAKVNICNKLGLTPIVAAVWSGNLSTVKLLVEAGAIIEHSSNPTEKNECDLSALMAASLLGCDDILKILLKKSTNVNQMSPVTGLTPLMLAAYNGHKEIAQIIIESGGNANKVDICGRTALDIARICNKIEVKAYLERLIHMKHAKAVLRQSDGADLFQAVKNGNLLAVKSILLENPKSINAVDPHDDTTPLMLAAASGHLDIVKELISSGADINAQDPTNGWTALMFSVFRRQSDIVHFLIEKGASLDIHSSNGCSALDLAYLSANCEPNIIEILTSHLELETPDDEFLRNLATSSSNASTYIPTAEKLSSDEPGEQEKEWTGGIADYFTFKFSLPSIKISSTINTPDPDETCDEVFLGDDGLPEHIVTALEEQCVEALPSPVLASTSSHTDILKKTSIRKLSGNKSPKPSVTSLQTPKLLKDYRKKCSVSISGRTLRKPMNSPKCLGLSKYFDVSRRCNSSSDSGLKPKSLEPKAEDEDLLAGSLTDVLNKLSLKKHVEKFREQEVDMNTFQYLTENDLNELGISSESQKKLMEIITKLKNT